jgi:hypothetical protein
VAGAGTAAVEAAAAYAGAAPRAETAVIPASSTAAVDRRKLYITLFSLIDLPLVGTSPYVRELPALE